jgi:hypothetical protein
LRHTLRAIAKHDPAWLHWVSRWLPATTRGTDNLPKIAFVSDMPWVRSSRLARFLPMRDTDSGWFDGTTPIAGLPYSKGILAHAFADERPEHVVVDVAARNLTTLKVHVGPCDNGSVQFQVLVDGKVKHETPVMRFGQVQPISVDVIGAKEVELRVLNGGDGNRDDSAGWGYARFLAAGAQDTLEEPPAELRSATEANAAFFLAEVHWRLDNKELARRWYDKAAEWMDENQPTDENLRRYRDEAAELLELSGTKPTAEANPPP